MRIVFDMDGTIADLYGVENWLDKIINEDATPYTNATVLVNMNKLAKALHKMQAMGNEVVIVSWLAKNGSIIYNEKVIDAKKKWLAKHLASVEWDEINIVEYGTPKSLFKGENGILFDDELGNRNEWGFGAFEPKEIFPILELLALAN